MPSFSRPSLEASENQAHFQRLDRITDPRAFECLNATHLPPLPISTNTPEYPEPGKKSHRNQLQCFFDGSRRLQSVFLFVEMLFPMLAINYCEEVQDPGARCYPTRRPSCMYQPLSGVTMPPEVTTVTHVSEYAYHYVLYPVMCALHAAHPKFRGHAWFAISSPLQGHPDDALIKTYHWRGSHQRDTSNVNMIAFVQAPWVLAERDFRNFIHTRSMPQVSRQLTGKERLWAKVYDECWRNNCRWFVVTSYDQWTFGVFSEGYTVATVTAELPSPRPRSAIPRASPSQGLFYWLCSSIGIPGTHVPDEFMETPLGANSSANVRSFTAEYQVFQPSDSEPTSDEDEGCGTHSCIRHGLQSELSFQTTMTSTPGVLKNHNLPSRQQGAVGLPLGGDMLTKSAMLPKRHKDRRRIEAIDWLEDAGFAHKRVERTVKMQRDEDSTGYGVSGGARMADDEGGHSSFSEGEESDEEPITGTKVGQVVGKAMFAVAPKRPYRHYQVSPRVGGL